MPNPFNPLDWLKSAQDWFSRAERSSGFRPFLIFLLLAFGFGLALLTLFPSRPRVETLALGLIGIPAVWFMVMFALKAHSDPDFCRSETHVQRLKKIELETMGSDTHQIPGDVLEQQSIEGPEGTGFLSAPDEDGDA